MTEYIKRDEAIEAAKHAWAKCLEPTQYIEIIPAADVAPVVRASYIEDGYQNKGNVCSNCGIDLPLTTEEGEIPKRLVRFCYYCGATMDGDDRNVAE